MQHIITAMDITAFRWINQEWHAPWLDPVMSMLSYIPLLWCILAVTFFILVRRCCRKNVLKQDKRRQLRAIAAACLLLACTTVATETVTYAIKQTTGRLRPCQGLAGTRYMDKGEWVERLQSQPVTAKHGSSFISGHASNSMALATTLGYLCPYTRPFVRTLPLFVGYSRVYLGKHYPTDVVGGWLVGWLISSCLCRIFGKRFSRKTAKPALLKRELAEA